MSVRRKTILLKVQDNRLIATDEATGLETADAGVEGEDGAVYLKVEIPEDWQDLTVRLCIVAFNGNYDESLPQQGGIIEMPLRAGVTNPGTLAVSLRGSDENGLRRTADLRSLAISPAAAPVNAIPESIPLAFEALREEVETQVVHTITGSGGALVTRTGPTEYNINVTGAGGDMLQANYAKGTGASNANKVDHAIYADSAAAATNAANAQNAAPGSALALAQGNYKTKKTITGSTALTDADAGSLISCSGSSSYTVTLPTPVGKQGETFLFWANVSSLYTITLSIPAGQFLGQVNQPERGTSSMTIPGGYINLVKIVSDGANWIAEHNTAFGLSGSWTPYLYGQTTAGTPTYATQFGRYVKLGNFVYCMFSVMLSAIGGMAGRIFLGGLPFMPAQGDQYDTPIYTRNVTATNAVGATIRVYTGQQYCALEILTSVSGKIDYTDVNASNLASNAEFKGIFWYLV